MVLLFILARAEILVLLSNSFSVQHRQCGSFSVRSNHKGLLPKHFRRRGFKLFWCVCVFLFEDEQKLFPWLLTSPPKKKIKKLKLVTVSQINKKYHNPLGTSE